MADRDRWRDEREWRERGGSYGNREDDTGPGFERYRETARAYEQQQRGGDEGYLYGRGGRDERERERGYQRYPSDAVFGRDFNRGDSREDYVRREAFRGDDRGSTPIYGARGGREAGRGGYGASGYGSSGYGRDHGRDDERDVTGYRGERGFFERAGDEMASWFGDDAAGRRRAHDAEQGDEGAQHHGGRGPRNYQRSDERIREDINDRLTDDRRVDATDIDVAVQNREVTLTGSVTSRFEKRRAEDIAEAVSGVTHVQNSLRVRQIGSGELGGGQGAGAVTEEVTITADGRKVST